MNVETFFQSSLRGLAQVMFQDNPRTGGLFLLGLAVASPKIALFAWMGSALCTLIAWGGMRAPQTQWEQGLFGFNGALVAIVLSKYFVLNLAFFVWFMVAMFASALVSGLFYEWLTRKRIPMLTAPFVLVSWVFEALGRQMPALSFQRAYLSEPNLSAIHTPLEAVRFFVEGSVNGLSEVFLSTGVATGLLFFAGLWVGSRRAAVAGLLGSAIGLGVGWLAGVAVLRLVAGIDGFNPALTLIALATTQVSGKQRTWWFSSLMAALSAGCALLLEPMLIASGFAVLTAPFVLTVWLVVWKALVLL